jgi:serine/threonine protein kinase
VSPARLLDCRFGPSVARCTLPWLRFRSPSQILEKFCVNYCCTYEYANKSFYAFGPFRLDSGERPLLRDGEPVTLAPKVVDTLLVLVQNAGHLVGKDDLMRQVWPDTFVEEGNLNKNVFILRKTLGQRDGGLEYIETVPKRGYRFVASVNRVAEEDKSSQPQTQAGTHLIGKKVSHYRVLEILGGGGMGVVYRAEDIKLGRRVALKFLPEELVSDTVALGRFEREARAASALNHPNICTIYAIEEHQGQPFIAMELLEGETLRELISVGTFLRQTSDHDGPLQLARLLDIAVQVASGLEAAHRKGIIHRDIKPANVFITSQEQAKILDFGLAKLQEFDAAEPRPASPVEKQPQGEWNSNLTLTRTGVTIGTAGYMSPEQVRGDKLDARTDLFSFGMVLYEMTTGQRAFMGDTAPVLREAILHNTPTPVRKLNTRIPSKLENIINKALEKDREARYQTASEIRADLENLTRDTESTHYRTHSWITGVGLCALLAIVGVVSWLRRDQPLSPLDLKQRQLTANSIENAVVSGAISPDGKRIAYSDRQGIHIKTIETGEVQTVPEPEELKRREVNWGLVPTWPQGSTSLIANVNIPGQEPSIWTVPLIGGLPHKLREHANAYSLSRDGSWLAFMPMPYRFGLGSGVMWVMKPDGSGAHKLFEPDEDSAFIGAEWSPSGERLAYNMYREDAGKSEIFIQTRALNGEPAITVVRGGTSDWSWSPDGRLVYGLTDQDSGDQSCNFWATPIVTTTGKPKGIAKRLTSWAGFCMDDLSETADGKRLAFRKWSWQGSVYVADLTANGTRITTPKRLTLNEGRNYPGAWTADSKAVVFGSYVDGQWKIFKQILDEETSEPITTRGDGDVVSARVSPDGAWILYIPVRKEGGNSSRVRQLMRSPINGGPPELVLTGALYGDPRCARSPTTLCVITERTGDLKQLIFTAFDVKKGRGQELLRLDTEPTADLDYVWDVSPDGNRIAILRYSAGTIRVLRLDGAPSYEMVAKGWTSLQSINWAADGNHILVSAASASGSNLLRLDMQGNAQVLWEQKGSIAPWNVPYAHWLGGPSAPWAVPSPDGRHIAIYSWNLSANMWVMENF